MTWFSCNQCEHRFKIPGDWTKLEHVKKTQGYNEDVCELRRKFKMNFNAKSGTHVKQCTGRKDSEASAKLLNTYEPKESEKHMGALTTPGMAIAVPVEESAPLQHRTENEHTETVTMDMRDLETTEEIITQPDGTRIERKTKLDRGKSHTKTVKEFQLQIVELQQKLALNKMESDRSLTSLRATQSDAINRAVHTDRANAEKMLRQRTDYDTDQHIALSSLSCDGGSPLDVYLLSKICLVQMALIEECVDPKAEEEWWVKREKPSLRGNQQVTMLMDNLVELSLTDPSAVVRKLPLLSNLGITENKLVKMKLWPEHSPVEEVGEEEEQIFPDTRRAPFAPPDFPSSIDEVPVEGWTTARFWTSVYSIRVENLCRQHNCIRRT